MLITEKRLLNLLRNFDILTPQQVKVLAELGDKAVKCLDCYCFKCSNPNCEKIHGEFMPFCKDCKKPVSPAKVRKCFML